jgi:hypothetical protein
MRDAHGAKVLAISLQDVTALRAAEERIHLEAGRFDVVVRPARSAVGHLAGAAPGHGRATPGSRCVATGAAAGRRRASHLRPAARRRIAAHHRRGVERRGSRTTTGARWTTTTVARKIAAHVGAPTPDGPSRA